MVDVVRSLRLLPVPRHLRMAALLRGASLPGGLAATRKQRGAPWAHVAWRARRALPETVSVSLTCHGRAQRRALHDDSGMIVQPKKGLFGMGGLVGAKTFASKVKQE